MYVSLDQIASSLQGLAEIHPFFGMAYLGFKAAQLPIGKPVKINVSQTVEAILQKHYRVTPEYEGFYNPFLTSSPAKRWVSRRYGSTTLQRIVADTFADAFVHEKRTSEWAWSKDYVLALTEHLPPLRLVPAYDLAVWLYRDFDIPAGFTPFDLCQSFVDEFNIGSDNENEPHAIFAPPPEKWPFPLQREPVPVEDLLKLIGFPPGLAPAFDLVLRKLSVQNVGPAGDFKYEAGLRLNIITGDNSLGKTFLLDLIYWALTGTWSSIQAIPLQNGPIREALIEAEVGSATESASYFRARYDWLRQSWMGDERDQRSEGLVVYARFDGSFSLWDPIRHELDPSSPLYGDQGTLRFSAAEVWDGLLNEKKPLKSVCNGLLRDCVQWQMGTGLDERYELFSSCLAAMSPLPKEPIRLASPERVIPLGASETPFVQMPYGKVPIELASAGVRRILSLSYMLVWAWFENKQLAFETRTRAHRRLVFLIDEVEAHLHPRWQREIVTALMEVLKSLGDEVDVQVHLATHSPMVLASAEPVFDQNRDVLHHLWLNGKNVVLEQLPFQKYGTMDFWLMSDVFGLDHPRSRAASEAIEKAKALQLDESPKDSDVAAVHKELIRCLAPDDEFWHRWLAFAEAHGVAL